MARKPVKKRSTRAKKPIDPKFDLSVGSDCDPFWVNPATIPPGISLQWIVPTTISRDKRNGWKPVFNVTPVGGQILMWAPYELARSQRDAEIARARKQLKVLFSDKNNGMLSPSFMCSSHYERIAPDTPPLDVEVTIPLRLSARQLDTASALNLTPHEYGQRIARMMTVYPLDVWPSCYGLPEFFPKKDEKK